MATIPKPSIVNIGVRAENMPSEIRESLTKAIQESCDTMKREGYEDFVSLPINPDDKAEAIAALVAVLQEKYRHALIIGGGLKKIPLYTALLEDIINTTKEVSPTTQILFTDMPTGVIESVKRLKPSSV